MENTGLALAQDAVRKAEKNVVQAQEELDALRVALTEVWFDNHNRHNDGKVFLETGEWTSDLNRDRLVIYLSKSEILTEAKNYLIKEKEILINQKELVVKEKELLVKKNVIEILSLEKLSLKSNPEFADVSSLGLPVNTSASVGIWLGWNITKGYPAKYGITRVATVQAILNRLFPPDGNPFFPVMLFKAPPLSGKTGMAALLCNSLSSSNIPFAALTTLDMNEHEGFESFFLRISDSKTSFSDFLHQKKERVLILDEAQMFYLHNPLRNAVKLTLQPRGYPGLRIVLFSSCGSFVSYREGAAAIVLPSELTFGLENDEYKPGLYLTMDEFKEMIKGSLLEPIEESAWSVCARHIGVTRYILGYVEERLKNSKEGHSPANVENTLRSSELLTSLEELRGIPSLDALQKVVIEYKVSSDDAKAMENILRRVSMGESVIAVRENENAIDLLLKVGFLFEDVGKKLHFASAVHMKVWLASTRKHAVVHLLENDRLEDFIVCSIERMSSSRLRSVSTENNDIIRERQLQMELYTAIVSCLPLSWLVTPEWRTQHVDLVVRGGNINWFIELLVDDDDSEVHDEGFQEGQKYFSSLMVNSRYVLIDFRQTKTVRKFRENCLYVEFGNEFKTATVTDKEKRTRTVSLNE